MSNAVVEVHNLRKTYGQKVAVADVSFAVAPGEIFGALGPNGSGKTTAVECIAGLREGDGGHIRVLGIDPQTHPERIREHVGVGNPKIAILDELSTGLDPQARRTTWEVVCRERDTGAAVLVVTHVMEEAERLCDRLIIIDHGRIIAEGSPQDLINSVDGARSLEDVFVAITPKPAAASITKGA
jgi:ABC-2 type transport system ATP-binding protein